MFSHFGPVATGILATAPIVMTSMALILHPRVGGAVSAAVIANSLTGLVGFATALVVLHVTAPLLGNAAALALWLLASMGWNLCLWGCGGGGFLCVREHLAISQRSLWSPVGPGLRTVIRMDGGGSVSRRPRRR